MASMKSLIDAYGLDDPVIDERGAFEADDAQEVYADLTARGHESAEAGLSAGAEYEGVNIIHLKEALGRMGHSDIKSTYSALIEGSKKHLRLYVGALGERGYSERHLTQDDCRDIIDG